MLAFINADDTQGAKAQTLNLQPRSWTRVPNASVLSPATSASSFRVRVWNPGPPHIHALWGLGFRVSGAGEFAWDGRALSTDRAARFRRCGSSLEHDVNCGS